MKNIYATIILAIVFIWAGMVMGISFLEAPLKFQAPGITLKLGLGIGQLVFGALTKIEMALACLLIAFLSLGQAPRKIWMLFALPIIIVIIDNAILMPILDSRTEMILSGIDPPPSSIHLWYVILEIIKLLALLICGFKFSQYHWRRLKNQGN